MKKDKLESLALTMFYKHHELQILEKLNKINSEIFAVNI